MAQLSDLADELLLQILANLGSKELATLALVSRHFSDLAQELLYRHVEVPTPPRTNSHRLIFKIVRTLLDRADLAQGVRSLRVEIPSLDEELSLNAWNLKDEDNAYLLSEGRAVWERAINAMPKTPLTDSSAWISSIMDCYEASWAGVVVALLPRPDRLDIMHANWDNGATLLKRMFSMSGGQATGALLEIPGLQRLTSLTLSGSDHLHTLNWKWATLPHLRFITLDEINPFRHPDDLTVSEVTDLVFKCNDRILLPNRHPFLAGFCAGFPHLTSLSVSIFEADVLHSIGKNLLGQFEVLVAKIMPLASSLLKLDLRLEERFDPDEPFQPQKSYEPQSSLKPANSLQRFERLKELYVTQEALFYVGSTF